MGSNPTSTATVQLADLHVPSCPRSAGAIWSRELVTAGLARGEPGRVLTACAGYRGGDDERAHEGRQVVAGRAEEQQDVLDPVDEARSQEDPQDGALPAG